MTTFSSGLLSLAIPCFALAPNRLMLAVASSPHGFKTVLTDAATLSQAHLIQPGRALRGRTPGKILLSRVLTATSVTSCRTPIVYAQDGYGRRRGVGTCSHAPQKRWARDLHPQFGSETFSQFPTGGKTECLESFREPIGHTCIRLHQVRKPFGKDPARASLCTTDKFADR